MEYKFMQIYGNCASVHCLGHTRIKGPVDNVVAKGIDFLKLLLHGDYCAYLKKTTPHIESRTPNFEGDHQFEYQYPLVDISHNDPTTEKAQIELAKRIENFKKFKQKVLTDKNYYFVYSINYYDLDKQAHTIRRERFIENLEYLKKEHLLHKIVFIETKNKNTAAFWNFYATNIDDLIKKYNLVYIQINDLTLGKNDEPMAMPQFYKKATKAIQQRAESEAAKKQQAKPKNYLGNSGYFGL